MPSNRTRRVSLEPLESRDTPTFTGLGPFTAGITNPQVAVSADFTGDGRADIAVANNIAGGIGAPTVNVVRSNGDGTFTQTDVFLTGATIATPRAIVTADFNGDGIRDLAVGSAEFGTVATGSVAVFLGNGNGTFNGPSFESLTPTSGIGVADFTGDGKLDLVTVEPFQTGNGGYRVFAGNGAGGFTPLGTPVPVNLGPTRVVTADFDRDGNQDFATIDSQGFPVTFYGNGNGTFTAGVVTNLGTRFARDLAAADFDGDGLVDLMTAESVPTPAVPPTFTGAVTFHRNPGGRNPFQTPGVDVQLSTAPFRRLTTADFNGNGRPDVVAFDQNNAGFVVYSQGGGNFTPDAGNPYPMGGVASVFDVVAGDFDGDLNQDFAAISNDLPFGRVFRNNDPIRTTTTLTVAPNPSVAGTPVVFTVTVRPAGVVALFPQGPVQLRDGSGALVGTGTLGPNGTVAITVTGLPDGSRPFTAFYLGGTDFGGRIYLPSNSLPVIVVVLPTPVVYTGSDFGAVVCTTQGLGTARFALGTFPAGLASVRPAASDFTRDGVPDFLVGSGPGSPSQMALVNGASKQAVFTVSPFGAGFTGGVFVAAGDIDADGTPDAAASADTGGGARVRVYLTRGNTVVPVVDFDAFGDPNFRGGTRIAFGDVNRDGFADLVVAAGPGGAPRVATFDGRALAAGRTVRLWNDFFAFDPSSRLGAFVAAGDTSGDGYADIVLGSENGGAPRVEVIDGRGLATTGVPNAILDFYAGPETDRGGVRVAVRDLNLDGFADIITGSGVGDGSRVRIYSGRVVGANPTFLVEYEAFPGLVGGVYVG